MIIVPGRRMRPHAPNIGLKQGPYRRADRKDRYPVKLEPYAPMMAAGLLPGRKADKIRPATAPYRKNRIGPYPLANLQTGKHALPEPGKTFPRIRAGKRPSVITAGPSVKASINVKKKIP